MEYNNVDRGSAIRILYLVNIITLKERKRCHI